jgi:hypothetical protein
MSEPRQVDLSLATFEDIIAELERREVVAALVVSHVLGGRCTPHPELPPEKRETVYADSRTGKHPALTAALLCDGIQWCLDNIIEDTEGVEAALRCAELSRRLHEFTDQLAALYPG